MNNSVQTSNNGQEWHNQAFAELFGAITAKLPSMTFWAILFSYGATAGLNSWAVHLPLFLSIPLSIAIQTLRFLTVFTPFLNPHGRASHLPEVIALGASIVSMFEYSFALQAMGFTGAEFWSLFLFGAAILVLSMILELQFINQGKKAFGLTAQKSSGGGAVIKMNAQQPTTLPAPTTPQVDVQALEDEIAFLRDQLQHQQSGNVPTAKAPKSKKTLANLNGFSSNGNGHKP